jgi:hypothetical protein
LSGEYRCVRFAAISPNGVKPGASVDVQREAIALVQDRPDCGLTAPLLEYGRSGVTQLDGVAICARTRLHL